MEAKALEAESRIPFCSTKEEALKSAILATEIYMKAIKLASNNSDRDRLKSKCMKSLARGEEIKNTRNWSMLEPKGEQMCADRHLMAPLSTRTLCTRENLILLGSSKLHSFVFPPWTVEPEEDYFQSRTDEAPYQDSLELSLSYSQQSVFAGWRRPYQIFQKRNDGDNLHNTSVEPTMTATKAIDLVQDVTADCSVVASLCAVVARAGNGIDQLLHTIFYPYDSNKRQPTVSANGKYVLRFYFNGCFRKVVIDDRLPDSTTTRALHVVDRQNPTLLWPALIEKAYLKVRGGYDFPGSNSGTDLWILTGWIPEQIFTQSDETNSEELWCRIFKSYGLGDVMITLGTGQISRLEEEGHGLAGEHDYAVVSMKEVDGQRLLLVKNPWCDGIIWKGSSCANKTCTQFPEKLETTAGTFWITFGDIVQNFESLYLNWNPGLFLYREDHHFSWNLQQAASRTCFTQNPQYSIRSELGGPVWILLSRHFSTAEGNILNCLPHSKMRSPLGFISLYVFDANGMSVHLSDGAILRGSFVDSPQTLIRFDMPPKNCYTLVVAQQDLLLPEYSFTLTAYSREPITLCSAQSRYPYQKMLTGSWTTSTTGGNASSPSYPTNPQFRVSITSVTNMAIVLETAQHEVPVHLEMLWAGGERVMAVSARDVIGDSGEYRRGCALAEISEVPSGLYTIVCSTFEQGQICSFTLRVESTTPCEVRPIASEAAGRLSFKLPPLIFQNGIDRMLAPVRVSRLTRIRVLAQHDHITGHVRAGPPLKVTLEKGQGPHKIILASSGDGEFSDTPAGVRITDVDISPQTTSREGIWLVVERFGGARSIDQVNVEVLSEAQIEICAWGTGDG